MSFFGLDCVKKKEEETERRIRANDREYNLSFRYATNAIKTSKYNLLTFLPLNLFEQFQRIANAYFLCLLVLQVIPVISSLSWFTTVVPLALVLTVTAVKDAIDDIVSTNTNTQNLLLLSSSEPLNLVYIETAELDGGFQKMLGSSVLCHRFSLSLSLSLSVGEVCCEAPNNRLDRFTGTLVWKEQKYPLDNQSVLLRGCTLRNTEWCFGMVLFAGPDTKLMQNCGKTSFKRTSIDRLMNVLVLFIFGFLVLMCIILAVGHGIWEYYEGSKVTGFVPREESRGPALSAFLMFWSYIIILNTVVPISLYVSMEVIRLGNSYYINWDRLMYYNRSDTPAEARTTTLNEELGQIRYIFSDKTGTLTQNIMTFNKCSINGKSYGTSLLEAVKLETEEVHNFFRLLALCHTVMAEEKNNGQYLVYQAQSPDEGALVTAARNFGFVFRSRTPESLTIVEMGVQRSYELLAILDFNNVRKRMSVIVRSPEGTLSLYCKGADTIIYQRLHESCSKLMEVTTEHLNEFAGEGLRTLVLAYKDLDEDYFSEWLQRHHEASTALEGREDKLNELYEEIEKDLLLIGASAVEDKLQDGVSQTIEQLAKADIKIWVLTGDKQETAENIGYSSVLSVTFLITKLLERYMELEFLRTACMCKTVMCCRVTPLQKAQVVELVKKYKQAVTLAIGDGANDVSMIKAAHIGVGISGQEGMQAVLSSDFSFAQFRFLQRLLLVHGRWSYLRMCKFLRYFFYKNFTFTFVHFWYAFFCGFSAQTVYDQSFIALYNLVYTSLPVLGMALFDQDVNDGWSLEFPQLYVPGQLSLYFSKTAFMKCALHSCYSSLVLFFIPYATVYDSMRSDGKEGADYQSFALLTQTCLTFTVCLQLSLDLSYWTAVNHLFVWGSLGMYFIVTFTMQSDGLYQLHPPSFFFVGTSRNTLDQFSVWLTVFLTAVLCVLPVLVHRLIFIQFKPTINDKVHQKKDQRPSPQRRTKIRRSSTRRSGYAFSHTQGYGDLVTSKRFLRRSAAPRSTGFTPKGRSPGFKPTGRSAGYSPSSKAQNNKQEVEPTELQQYRTVQDSTF
uniref:Phospholipid-transporting ATPase n=1 Tax=Pygocentrus nattereri TaxID=42514 RepID=A0AAR2K6S2_PYGNA